MCGAASATGGDGFFSTIPSVCALTLSAAAKPPTQGKVAPIVLKIPPAQQVKASP